MVCPPKKLELDLLAQAREDFPKLVLIPKESHRLSLFINRILRPIAFGGDDLYLRAYTTTFGQRIYTPVGWDRYSSEDRYIILRHELVHVRQFQRFGWLGIVFLYALFLPTIFAFGRTYLEWQAYRETILATAQIKGLDYVLRESFTEGIVRQFTTGAYLFMWPFPFVVRKWVHNTISDLEKTLR